MDENTRLFFGVSDALQGYINGDYWGDVHHELVKADQSNVHVSQNLANLAIALQKHDADVHSLEFSAFYSLASEILQEKYDIGMRALKRGQGNMWAELAHDLLLDYLRLLPEYKAEKKAGRPHEALPTAGRRQALFSHLNNLFPTLGKKETYLTFSEANGVTKAGDVRWVPLKKSQSALERMTKEYLGEHSTQEEQGFSYFRWADGSVERHNTLRRWAFGYVEAGYGWPAVSNHLKPSALKPLDISRIS